MKSKRLLLALWLVFLLAACKQDAPPASSSGSMEQGATELKFDRRYLDSIYLPLPHSPRVAREREIEYQLGRLESYKKGKANAKVEPGVAPYEETPVTAGRGDKLTDYPTRAAMLADIYRHIDSLKVLENIPLTEYPEF